MSSSVNGTLKAAQASAILLDAISYRFLRELQRDRRMTNQELSQRVGLSPSPCLRRVPTANLEGQEGGEWSWRKGGPEIWRRRIGPISDRAERLLAAHGRYGALAIAWPEPPEKRDGAGRATG